MVVSFANSGTTELPIVAVLDRVPSMRVVIGPFDSENLGRPPGSASRGGAIGQDLPTALGAALARPDRRVIVFQTDGSGLYTMQALWSMTRENADVTVVVCANRHYRILQTELARACIARPRPRRRSSPIPRAQ
jgi:hypothetical protein